MHTRLGRPRTGSPLFVGSLRISHGDERPSWAPVSDCGGICDSTPAPGSALQPDAVRVVERRSGMNPEQIWQAAQEELRFQLSKPSYETWLKNASLVSRERNAFRIGVPTKLAKDWLEDRYSAMIKETLSAIVSGDVSVAFEVMPGQPEPLRRASAVAVAEEPPPEEEPVLAEASQ